MNETETENTVENIEHLKYSFYLTTQKNTLAVTSPPKNTDSRN